MPVNGPERRTAARLVRDTAGNTLAIMAASMIPVTALAGSAIDTARMYVVKVRLQQACDAGVLAGRKFMESSNNATLDAKASDQAGKFFTNNFASGWMQTTAVSFTPTKTTDQQVAGTATATVPMTIMKMFAAPAVKLNVACEARYDVADTDIVFVLDTTGSMACLPSDSSEDCSNYVGDQTTATYTRPSNSSPNQTTGYAGSTGYAVPEKSGSRISALRTAVKNFYKAIKDNIDPTTNVRYGFVTYASSVNAGGAIMAVSPALMASSWTYQTRQVTDDYQIGDLVTEDTSLTEAQCKAQPVDLRTPKDGNSTSSAPWTYDSGTGTATIINYGWNSYSTKSGTRYKCVKTTKTVGPRWTYRQTTQNVSDFIAGRSVQDPTKKATAKTSWAGCVEAPPTTAGTTSFTTGSLPADLDPQDRTATWGPLWPEVTYGRNNTIYYYRSNGRWYAARAYSSTAEYTSNGDGDDAAPWFAESSKFENGNVACGKPIRRLAKMEASDIAAYVDAVDFKPIGGTYHDLGMIWGTRLLAPNGMFAADTTAWPGRQQPKRVIVFLTDGDMSPSTTSLSMYGLEWFGRRVSGGDFDNLKAYHNARFLAECDAAKSLNIDVWTVAIGLDSTTELKKCATTEAQALDTTSGDGLSAEFEKIAKQVAMLRVSK